MCGCVKPQKPASAKDSTSSDTVIVQRRWLVLRSLQLQLQVLFGSQKGARHSCSVTPRQWNKQDGAACSAHRQALLGRSFMISSLVLLLSPAIRASTAPSRIGVQCVLPCTASSVPLSKFCAHDLYNTVQQQAAALTVKRSMVGSSSDFSSVLVCTPQQTNLGEFGTA